MANMIFHISMDECLWMQCSAGDSVKRGDMQEAERSKRRSHEQHWVTERRAPSHNLMHMDRGVM